MFMNKNDKQQKVIDEVNNDILLLATAGTGKTETLTSRVCSIIMKGLAKPEEILCLTFTNKACKEMQNRIQDRLGKESKGIIIKTFHSFCLQIIRENAKRNTDVFIDFTPIDEDDSKEIIKNINSKDLNVNCLYKFICKVKEMRIARNIISDDDNGEYKDIILNELRYNNEIMNNICRVKNKNNKWVFDNQLKNILLDYGYILISKYDSELNKNHMLDFNDLVLQAKKIFQNQEVVNIYKNKFKYIHIDEFQDTGISEYLLLEKLFSDNKVLLCGDVFQTIYEWRGANPNKIIERFKLRKPKIIEFDENYRATKELTNLSIQYLKKSFNNEYNEIYKNSIISESNIQGDKAKLFEAKDREEEAEFINNTIEKIYNIDNQSRTCILTRDNKLNQELSECLESLDSKNKKYEFILVDEYKFFRRQEIKDIVAILKLLINSNDTISLKRILRRFPLGVGDETIKKIESDNNKEIGIKISDFIDEKVMYGEYFSLLVDDLSKNIPIVIFDVESTGVNVTEDEIVQIAAIKIDSNGEIVDKFVRFLKPNKSVGKSYLVHGFSDEYLEENGEDSKDVIDDFIEFYGDSIIVGHNVQYDINILQSEMNRLNMKAPKFKAVYDTLDIYRRFYPKLINYKLSTLSAIFKLPHKPTHNALDDVIATGDLLIKVYNDKIKNTVMDRIAVFSDYYSKFNKVNELLNNIKKISESLNPAELSKRIVKEFNFDKLYHIDEDKKRIQRINKFINFLDVFTDKDKSNRDALIEVINITALSNGELEELMIRKKGVMQIPIITVHQAKGLEYDNVFVAGLEENRFPGYLAVKSNKINEEKRAFYVAITRAKKRLYLSYSRFSNGRLKTKSRFLDDIGGCLVDSY